MVNPFQLIYKSVPRREIAIPRRETAIPRRGIVISRRGMRFLVNFPALYA